MFAQGPSSSRNSLAPNPSQSPLSNNDIIHRRSSPSPIPSLPAFSTGTTATSSSSTVLLTDTGNRHNIHRNYRDEIEMISAGKRGYTSGNLGRGFEGGIGVAGRRLAQEEVEVDVIEQEEEDRSGRKHPTIVSRSSRTTITPETQNGLRNDYPSNSNSYTSGNNKSLARTPTPPLIDFDHPASPPLPPQSSSSTRSSPRPNHSQSTPLQPDTQRQPTKLQELLARMQKPIARPDISPSKFRTTGAGAGSISGSEAGSNHHPTSHAQTPKSGLKPRRSYGNLRNGSVGGNDSPMISTTRNGISNGNGKGRKSFDSPRPPSPSPAFPRRSRQQQQSHPQPRSDPSSSRIQPPSQRTSPRPLSPIPGTGIWRDGRSKNGFPPPSPSRGALRAVTPEEELPEYLRRRSVADDGQRDGDLVGKSEEEEEGYDAEPEEEDAVDVDAEVEQSRAMDRSRADATLGSGRNHHLLRGDEEYGSISRDRIGQVSGGFGHGKGKSRQLLVDLGSANGASSSSGGGIGSEGINLGEEDDEEGSENYGQGRDGSVFRAGEGESDSDDYLLRQRRMGGGVGGSARTPRAGEGMSREEGRREVERYREEDSPPPRVRIRPKRKSEDGVAVPQAEERPSQRNRSNPQLLNYLASHPEPPSEIDIPIPHSPPRTSASTRLAETSSHAPSTIRGKKKWIHSSPQISNEAGKSLSGGMGVRNQSMSSPSVVGGVKSPLTSRLGAIPQPWASPSMDSFVRGIEDTADREPSLDLEASILSGMDMEDRGSVTEQDEIQEIQEEEEEEFDAEDPSQPAPEMESYRERDRSRDAEKDEISEQHQNNHETPSKNRSTGSRQSLLTPRPPTPDESPGHGNSGSGQRSRTTFTTPPNQRSQSAVNIGGGQSFQTARTSPNNSRSSPLRSRISRSGEASNSSARKSLSGFSQPAEPDEPLPDPPEASIIESLPIPEDQLHKSGVHSRQAPTTPSRRSLESDSRMSSAAKTLEEQQRTTPIRSTPASDRIAKTPHPPGGWTSFTQEDRKVRFTPPRRESPAKTSSAATLAAGSTSVERKSQPAESSRAKSLGKRRQAGLGEPVWRDTLRSLRQEVGELAEEKPLPATPSDTPDIAGEDPTFSTSILELEAQLASIDVQEKERLAALRVDVANRNLRNGIAALAGMGWVGQSGEGVREESGATGGKVGERRGWLPYLGTRAFYAWAVFRLFVALQERDANQFDPFLLTSPHHPFLHTSSLFDLVRDVLVMANTSSSTLSSVLGEGSGLLELFLGGGEGSVPMRLPC